MLKKSSIIAKIAGLGLLAVLSLAIFSACQKTEPVGNVYQNSDFSMVYPGDWTLKEMDGVTLVSADGIHQLNVNAKDQKDLSMHVLGKTDKMTSDNNVEMQMEYYMPKSSDSSKWPMMRIISDSFEGALYYEYDASKVDDGESQMMSILKTVKPAKTE